MTLRASSPGPFPRPSRARRRPRSGARRAWIAAAGVALLVVAVGAAPCGTTFAVYSLGPGSTAEEGCMGACLCPVRLFDDLGGAMLLAPAPPPPGGLFRVFSVQWIQWMYGPSGSPTFVTGNGTYQVGGEVALTQRLSLDLRVGDQPVQHYDSGIVPGGVDTGAFPPIDISISDGALCFGRSFHVIAKPRTVYAALGAPQP
jgi:hypothetical protein